jgi:predicted O-methyltransferase YrrM
MNLSASIPSPPMSNADLDKDALEAFRATSLERELAEREEELAWTQTEFRAFRNRRVIRLTIWLISPLMRLKEALRRLRHDAQGEPESEPEPAGHDRGGEGRPLFFWPSLVHFHSPVPDTRILSQEPTRSRLWPEEAPEQVGLDWRGEEQLALVRDELARQEPMLFPDEPTDDPTEFFASNPAFAPHDAWALQAMLRHLRPRRMVEVGSGWTTLIAARVNREHLDGEMRLTCIDPFPQEFIRGGVEGISELVERPIEDGGQELFSELEAGDVLFIDSTHTVKTGGDVAFLFGEVVPRLRPGVTVHIHDIFLPGEYPQQWALSGWGWNEQYLVQAFLTFNEEFEVVLSLGWLAHRHPEVVEAAVPNFKRFYPGRGGAHRVPPPPPV